MASYAERTVPIVHFALILSAYRLSAAATAAGLREDAVSCKSKTSQVSQPLLQSGIFSSIATPVPPSVRATRHEGLSRRRRKNGSLVISREFQASHKHHRTPQARKSLTPQQRNLGLEIRPENLVWKGWEPGEEYTKNFTIKNINVQTKKIKYKAPSSMFFSTLYPEVIVLSAGTSFTLPITFKPLERVKYQDKMEFSSSQGSFTLQLQGLLPETNLHIPECVHFGLSAVHEASELSFEIRNLSGELETEFAWDVPEPFEMQPRRGSLQPKSSTWIRATFHPTSATVYDATVVCFYGENMKKTMRIEGVGKYPHLLVNSNAQMTKDDGKSTVVSFDRVGIRNSAQKFIYLHNLSNVKAPFKIERSEGQAWMDEVFTCHIDNNLIPPMAVVKIPITYCPHIPNRTDTDYFEVSTLGNISKSVFQCIGQSEGPNVIVSTSLVQFDLVHAPDHTSRRSFQIHNQSNSDAIYQFDLHQESGVFRIDQSSGILEARQSKTVIITFNPTKSINYRRRLVLMVHEMGPLFIDLIGTHHNDNEKPPPLKSQHLDRYDVHSSRGLCFYPPHVWKQQLHEGKLVLDKTGCYTLLDQEQRESEGTADKSMAIYFDDGHHTLVTSNPPHVSLNQMSVWFGEVSYNQHERSVEQVTIQLSNHTHGKVTAHWIEETSGIFEVVPPSCDILPMKTVDFRIIFQPDLPNKMYGTQLECYVTYKVMRDFQLVDEEDILPPWLATLDVCGHTFNGKNVTFLPEVSLDKERLVFSPALPHQSTYRTMAIRNDGTIPYLYQFLPDKEDFTVKPAFGFEQSTFSVSAIRFTPSAVKTCESDLMVRLNDNATYNKTVKLVATGEEPELLLSNHGDMFFRPSCLRTSVTRDYEVKNVGRSVCWFKWVISKEDSLNVTVDSEEGCVLPNQTQAHKWTFTPTEYRKYVLKATCLVWPCDGSKGKEELSPNDAKKYKLRIVGEGAIGDVRAEKYNIEFGSVIAGQSQRQTLVLFNDSLCDVHVSFSLKQVIDSQYGEDPKDDEPMCLKLSAQKATIPARSKVYISAVARPYRRVLYTWLLYHQLLNESGSPIHSTDGLVLSELSAEGVYPTMEVIDARPSGSGSSISKTQLWRWFSIDNLNSSLDSDPETAELRYTIGTRHSAHRRPSTYTKSVMDFNFGASGVNSDPCYVSVMVKNTGSVPTEWSFLFPKDLELEVDYWAESGVFEADELHELHIQDNKLFTIHPSKGILNPGEHRTILFTYKHDIPGTHRVPVLLKIEKGKEILLNFVGVTVEPNRRYLHFPGTKHVFTPVPIGEMTPPKQLYEMFNGGTMSVMYEVDQAPLRNLESENFHHSVLTCLNPKGEIAPGMSANMEWIFSPLESKTYSIDIPIHIVGGETALITFEGIGYDGRAMGNTMPKLDQPPEFTSVPRTQKVSVPGQILFMSEERISFGNMPLFGKARHVIFLTNQSDDRPIAFSWHATSPVVNDVLSIEPTQGRLKPGQSTMVRIEFCAAGQPSFYDLDLVCEVVNEIQVAEYHAELKAWRQERERQNVEFTITGDEVVQESPVRESTFEMYSGSSKYELSSPKRNIDNILNKSQSPVRLTESNLAKTKTKAEFKNYQTLPPIRFENPVKLPSNRSRLLRHQEASVKNEWIRPQHPNPFIAHLCVTARTHDIAQYRMHFRGGKSTQFIDRTMQLDVPVPPKSASEAQYPLTTCSAPEKSMVVTVMSDVLRGLLDDPTFHQAVQELNEEDTPYFQQLPHEEEDGNVDVVEQPSEVERRLSTEEPSKPIVNVEDLQQGSSMKLMSDMLGPSDVNVWNYPSTFDDEPNQESTEGDATGQIKRSPLFGSLLEDVLSSTLSNIMEEAMKGEVLLHVRPRVVALPPSSNPSIASSSKKCLSETMNKPASIACETDVKKSVSSPIP